MKILTDLGRVLDKQIHTLSELSDHDLDAMILTIERAYVHTLIEKGLRMPAQEAVGVSRIMRRARRG